MPFAVARASYGTSELTFEKQFAGANSADAFATALCGKEQKEVANHHPWSIRKRVLRRILGGGLSQTLLQLVILLPVAI